MIRNLIILSLLLLLFPRLAHADAKHPVYCPTVDLGSIVYDGIPVQKSPKSEWLACQSNDQCVLVWGGCRDMAINKAYTDQFKPSTDCDGVHAMPHEPNAVAQCSSRDLCGAVVPPPANCHEFGQPDLPSPDIREK